MGKGYKGNSAASWETKNPRDLEFFSDCGRSAVGNRWKKNSLKQWPTCDTTIYWVEVRFPLLGAAIVTFSLTSQQFNSAPFASFIPLRLFLSISPFHLSQFQFIWQTDPPTLPIATTLCRPVLTKSVMAKVIDSLPCQLFIAPLNPIPLHMKITSLWRTSYLIVMGRVQWLGLEESILFAIFWESKRTHSLLRTHEKRIANRLRDLFQFFPFSISTMSTAGQCLAPCWHGKI